MVRRTGRRPGNPDTRAAILAAAGETFAAHGYDQASIRRIAAAAGVDPALVHHYFGTKEKLFAATLDFPVDPAELVPQLFIAGPDQVGERMVRTFLRVWDSPAGNAGLAVLRSATNHPFAARLLREFLRSQILSRVTTALELDPAEAPLRMSLTASQMAGLGLTRYVLRMEPLASADPEFVASLIGPTVQRYLTGELPG